MISLIRALTRICVFFIFFVAALLLYAAEWLLDSFANLSVESIVFHLLVPLQGTETSYIEDFIRTCVIPAIAYGLLGLVLYILVNCDGYRINYWYMGTRRELLLCWPRIFRRGGRAVMPVAVLLVSAGVAATRIDLPEYLAFAFTDSTFVEENYADPQSTTMIFPEQDRNLIYIFMESMETTFMSVEEGGGKPYNLIPELTELAREHTHFSNSEVFGGAQQAVGTSWTIAGMFAATSGLPLLLPIEGNSMSHYEYFFPGVFPIGRILQERGYNQSLMVGSEASFGGRQLYFTQHGEYEILDVFAAERDGIIPVGRRVFWGMEDMLLYEYAQQEILRLAALDQPFNFTMLTVDTHHVDGFLCALCPQLHERQYNNVIMCASKQLYDFITWIKAQAFYENTTIIVAGDHLSMQPDLHDFISHTNKQTTFNMIINSSVKAINTHNRDFTSMDMFPTTLAAMGVEILGDRLALGTNLFSDTPTLLEIYGWEKFNDELRARSHFYNSLMVP